MIDVNGDAVLATLRTLAGFGASGTGVCRPALSAADLAARRWLAGEMEAIGLAVTLDAVGNLYGAARGVERTVLIGSHSDSVPTGGWLDGTLGLAYGLEIARARAAAHPGAPVGIDLVDFSDEEGRFLSCLGSRSFCGELTALPAGFAAAAAAAGLPEVGPARLDPARHRAFFEAHIEQGPRLEAAGRSIGLVTGIFGMRRYAVRFAGRADHAGTTPIALRRDAARLLYRFADACDARFRRAGSADSVWNLGKVALEPGAVNVVTERAELLLEIRDLDPAALDALSDALAALVAETDGELGVRVTLEEMGRLPPVSLDPGLQALVAAGAAALGAPAMPLPSGAIHDAMVLARRVPSAMLFVPSVGGRSHTPVEDTRPEDIVLGARVLAHAVFACADTL
ncbi:hydantoinase/carbamoylase family amidase [Azospirillum halopraeferens]|uniref:hydantoinase/carbamoylase family amidase n=1 Tax=Azospirillum halopraeferens TaxID=34010 RepID=UPI000425A427|nr:hydantoinase/carbamoylase family amidase [Azospirillum halopraeferens]